MDIGLFEVLGCDPDMVNALSRGFQFLDLAACDTTMMVCYVK